MLLLSALKLKFKRNMKSLNINSHILSVQFV